MGRSNYFLDFFLKEKLITFESTNNDAWDVVEVPKSATKSIPSWYKRLRAVNLPRKMFNGRLDLTVKACVPFRDAMTAGYIYKTWTDIYITEVGDEIEWVYACQPNPFIVATRKSIPTPIGCHENEFAWQMYYAPITPKGYSCLIQQPLNDTESPFVTTAGVIDTDTGLFAGTGSIPFFIKKGFTGLIPAGTPILQIIPFKREIWKSERIKLNEKTNLFRMHKIFSKLIGGYSQKYWVPKKYD